MLITKQSHIDLHIGCVTDIIQVKEDKQTRFLKQNQTNQKSTKLEDQFRNILIFFHGYQRIDCNCNWLQNLDTSDTVTETGSSTSVAS